MGPWNRADQSWKRRLSAQDLHCAVVPDLWELTHWLPWAGTQVTLSFILEVTLDVATESTIVSIAAKSGMGQPFPGTGSLGGV